MRKVSLILPYYNRKKLLLNTLNSLNFFYSKYNLEVVIIDDVSIDSEQIFFEDYKNLDLNIKVIKLKIKNGINPCYPYNVGVRESSGDILLLSSPETFHTADIFKLCNNFYELTDSSYLLFSVFCLTDKNIINKILSNTDFNDTLRLINNEKNNFYLNLGINGYSYNNNYGSWYLHSSIKPSGLNFMSAITKQKFYSMSGFDERYRYGTGYDDNEFKDRLVKSNTLFKYYDEALCIHINHSIVNNALPTTNENLYKTIKEYNYNDYWGRIA